MDTLIITCPDDRFSQPISVLQAFYWDDAAQNYCGGELHISLPARIVREIIQCFSAADYQNVRLYSATELLNIAETAVKHRPLMQRLHDMAVGFVVEKTAELHFEKKLKLSSFEAHVLDTCRSNRKGALFEQTDRTQLPKKALLSFIRALPKGKAFKGSLKLEDAYKTYANSGVEMVLSPESWFDIIRAKFLVEGITTAGAPAQSPPRTLNSFVRFTGQGIDAITRLWKLTDAEVQVALRDLDVTKSPYCEWSQGIAPRKDPTLVQKAQLRLLLELSGQKLDRMQTLMPNVMDVADGLMPNSDKDPDLSPRRKQPRLDLVHKVQMAAKPSEEGRNNRRIILSALDAVIGLAKQKSLQDEKEDMRFGALESTVRGINFAVRAHTLTYRQASDALHSVFQRLPQASKDGTAGLLVKWWDLELCVGYENNFTKAITIGEELQGYFNNESVFGAELPVQLEMLIIIATLYRRADIQLPAMERMLSWKQASLKEEFTMLAEALERSGKKGLAQQLSSPEAGYLEDDHGLRFPRFFGSAFLSFDIKGLPA